MGELLHHVGRRNQREVIEAARPRIQQTETVLARSHPQDRFDAAIDQYLVAQHTFGIHLVVEQLAAGIETPVVEVQRIVVWMAG
ncbi:hypothetical protein D3C85_1278450 [compost metagenome]